MECYFCSKKSRLQSHKGKSAIRDHLPIITGSIHHFLCPYCESWNIKDRRTGEFVDNVQAIHNEAPPGVGAVQRRRSARLQDTPFCHNCLTNQQLQIQLLGGFLPAQITPREENELLARLPAYKESLNSRYPLVCAHCEDRIDDIIKERNWKAKARTVGGWLKNSASLAKNAVKAHPQGRDTLDRLPSLWLWRVKGICWAVLYTSTAMLATSRSYIDFNRLTFRLDAALGPYLLRDMAPWRSIAAIITIFCSFWDPTYKERCQRGGRVEVKGYRRWMVR